MEENQKTEEFPSPLGVIFPLIGYDVTYNTLYFFEFPSPLGVIFPLIEMMVIYILVHFQNNFRLLSELYSLLF